LTAFAFVLLGVCFLANTWYHSTSCQLLAM
jgi:hypothetical protein